MKAITYERRRDNECAALQAIALQLRDREERDALV